MHAAELAGLLSLPLDGDGGAELTGAAALEQAGPTDLAFVAHPNLFEAAARSRAGCLIAPPKFEEHTRAIIRSESPRASFAQALAILFARAPLQPGAHPSAVIHSDAHVDPTAEIGPHASVAARVGIGAGTRVGAGCRIGEGAFIGADCELHPNVSIYPRTRIGDRVVLHSGCVLGADGFGFVPQNGRWVKFPQVGFVLIENDVEIGANTCVDRGALGVTRIGRGTKLDNMVHIGHNCDIGCDVVVAAQTGFSGGVTVGDNCVIGGQVGVGDKARIEPGSVIGSGSGILTSKIVRAGEPQWGTPARPLRQHLKQLAALGRLNDLWRRVKDLEKK